MILEDLFGSTTRIKILEELLSKWGEYLSVEEISRMADVSRKSVYIHMSKLESIGLLDVKNDGFKTFRLKQDDERTLALILIESNEYARQLNGYSVSFITNSENSIFAVYDAFENDHFESSLFIIEPIKSDSSVLRITME